MRTVFTILLLALGFTAVGQVFDFGVTETRDEFTGVYSCRHMVNNALLDGTGITMVWAPDGAGSPFLYITRDWSTDSRSWVWNSASNSPRPDDLVYLRFPDGEVISRRPNFVGVETDGPIKVDVAGFGDVGDLIYRILASPGDLRVRFSGMNGDRDFTIYHGVITTLAAGFGQTCLR